jgi:hypothetical protein
MNKKLFGYSIGNELAVGICKAETVKEVTNHLYDTYPLKRDFIFVKEITDEELDEYDLVEIHTEDEDELF